MNSMDRRIARAYEAADVAQVTWPMGLKRARKALGLSQASVAKAAGVTHSIVSRWESGRFPPDANHLARLTAFYRSLGVPFDPLGGSLAPSFNVKAARLERV